MTVPRATRSCNTRSASPCSPTDPSRWPTPTTEPSGASPTARSPRIATDLGEPSGLYVEGRDLVVVESSAHRLTRIPLDARVAAVDFSHSTQRPVTEVAATLRLDVPFTPPPGQKVDDRFGPSSQLLVTSTPPGLLRSGEGRSTDLTRELVLDPHVGTGVLHIAARSASCDVDSGEGAACRMHQQDWGVPVRIGADGDAVLTLPLGGAST